MWYVIIIKINTGILYSAPLRLSAQKHFQLNHGQLRPEKNIPGDVEGVRWSDP